MKSTSKNMTDAAMKKSETAIRQAFHAVDSAEFTAEIAIHDSEPSATLISNVSVEFLIGKLSSIRISCKNDNDADIYRDKGLSKRYSVEQAKLMYKEYKDFQSTYKELTVKPIMIKTYITIRLRKKG
ncbi:hypothetical protein P9314_04745 [Paenibacillus validus]|uniref:Uncharacterized protein n=1 Tax=Paenibacillus chartarius TaxID=747481 RepID=A0ABV6DMI0_9BACL|nr:MULTISPECIES: hypothetical protein [Paenibacillaceae]MED4600016.1 hypothetical protein [Paenibacillus validus]MED4605717.1 hypothetical protein [Paenibacillus validus]